MRVLLLLAGVAGTLYLRCTTRVVIWKANGVGEGLGTVGTAEIRLGVSPGPPLNGSILELPPFSSTILSIAHSGSGSQESFSADRGCVRLCSG